jgi:hypothetical protein
MMSLENLTPDARDELAALAKALAENPKTRKEFLRLTKTAHPDLPVPELDIEDQTTRALSAQENKIAQLEARLKEKDARAELERRRLALKEKNLVGSDDDISEIEKLMVKEGISNHETAAKHYQWMKQADRPTPAFSNSPITSKVNDFAKYMRNPAAAAREAAASALNELRQGSQSRPIGLR